SITAADKVYDGNTDAAILTRTLSGVIAGDTVTYTSGTAAFADKNAGLDKTVTATGLALSGADATNYTVNTEAQTIADITKASLTISGLAANNKTYDATRDAVLSGTPTLTGVLTGDSVTVIGAADTGIFDTKDVGTDKPVTANLDSLTLGGTDGGNYRITAVTTPLTADITALGITGNITVENKVYDGNTNATISGRTLSGVLGADDVHYTGGTAAFSDRNAGAGKMVTATELELSGEDAGNYTVNTEAQTTADIMQAPLIVTASTDAKIYDGTTSSSAMPAITGGYMIEGDSIAMKQAFDNKNAGEGKTLIPSVIIDDGNGGNNYNATMATDTTGVIGKAPLTITADDKTRIYGNANPEFTGVITGFAGGETLSMSGVAGSALYTTDAVQTSDAGTYDIIPETGTLSAVNYRFDAFVKGSLVIGKAPLSVISDDKTKFSGEANPAFTASYSGFTLGQTESVLGGSLSFETPATASSPIGNYPITPYGLTSGNYQIAFFDGNLLVNPPPSLQDEINAVVVAVNNTATAGGVKEAIIFFGKDNEEDTQSKEGQDAGEKREALPYCN
ncbi:MAG: hypothetical protein JW943_03980, partial [Deltaproteobacteria bacterium]|nr:hypothetical protein [Deltaproteobacteria bacterium]